MDNLIVAIVLILVFNLLLFTIILCFREIYGRLNDKREWFDEVFNRLRRKR